jgi:S-adenosylmethionine:tRNA ribosyltransferase-isomerase
LAVGTTCARALEDQGQRWGEARLEPGTYRTRLFIQPGFAWRWVDGLITNFHLPKSSLLVLVASLMGYEEMREAYRVAVARGLRFYSYGDAMFAWRQGLGER